MGWYDGMVWYGRAHASQASRNVQNPGLGLTLLTGRADPPLLPPLRPQRACTSTVPFIVLSTKQNAYAHPPPPPSIRVPGRGRGEGGGEGSVYAFVRRRNMRGSTKEQLPLNLTPPPIP